MDKQKKYETLLPQAAALIEAESDRTALMANLAALIQDTMGFFWTGFYRVKDGELVLGPFQGPIACTRIAFGRGVCGTAWKERRTIVVRDVEEFPGHIACSSLSRSEIVVPVFEDGEVIAVLDIDSRELGTFDEIDQKYLEQLCGLIRPIRKGLEGYIRSSILPRYAAFDKGHREDHAEAVIAQALSLARFYPVDREMVFTAAACHDLGLAEDRQTHHLVSGRLIREDSRLREWFSAAQIETIAQAAEDHRASLDHDPRTIYGRIIAEADRQIDAETVIRRTIQYGLGHYPELDREGHWRRFQAHLKEKYGDGGYLKLWIPESPNAERLAALRTLIRDEAQLRPLFEQYFDEQTATSQR